MTPSPDAKEFLRAAAVHLGRRKAMSDYMAVAFLADSLGPVATLDALLPLADMYSSSDEYGLSALSQFAFSCQENPADIGETPFAESWARVKAACLPLGIMAFEAEMSIQRPEGATTRDFNRSTNGPSSLAVANIVCRGGTNDWRKLYRELKESPEFRQSALKALAVADTEAFPGCVLLFEDAIHKMNASPAV